MAIYSTTNINAQYVSVRWQEDYASSALNKKFFGVLNKGIYSGFLIGPSGLSGRHIQVSGSASGSVWTGVSGGYVSGNFDETLGYSIAVDQGVSGYHLTVSLPPGVTTSLDATGRDGTRVYVVIDANYSLNQGTSANLLLVDSAQINSNPSYIVVGYCDVPANPSTPLSASNFGYNDSTYPRLSPTASSQRGGLMTPDSYGRLLRFLIWQRLCSAMVDPGNSFQIAISPSQAVDSSTNARIYSYVSATNTSRFPRSSSGAYNGGANNDQLTYLNVSTGLISGAHQIAGNTNFSVPSVSGTPNSFQLGVVLIDTDDNLFVSYGSVQTSLVAATQDSNIPSIPKGNLQVCSFVVSTNSSGIIQPLSPSSIFDRRPFLNSIAGNAGVSLSISNPLPVKNIASSGSSASASRSDHVHSIDEYNAGSSGSAITIDWNNGSRQVFTVTSTCNVSFSNAKSGSLLILRIRHDEIGGGRAILPTSVIWEEGATRPLLQSYPYTQEIFYIYCNGDLFFGLAQKTSSSVSALVSRAIANPECVLALDSSGSLLVSGVNSSGLLFGDGSTTVVAPRSFPYAFNFQSIAASTNGNFVVATSTSGFAYSWGSNTNGFLGDGSISSASSPVSVLGGRSFSQVAAGNSRCFGLQSGILFGWGFNNNALGDGTNSNRSSPVSIIGGRTYSGVSSSNGADFSFAIEASTGNAYAWGSNFNGQLGDGTATSRTSPNSVIGGRSFTQISAGVSTFAVGIEGSTGNAYSWGTNGSGQLGDGTTTARSSPVSVLGGRSFSSVSAGVATCLAIEAGTGVVYGWGSVQNFGFSSSGATFPVPARTNSFYGSRSFSTIIARQSKTIGIDGATGLMWNWGSNVVGQLGDGSQTFRSSPVSVLGGRVFSQIDGDFSVVAIEKSTGNAYAWGGNSSGQLGDNSTQNRSSPVSVLGGRSFSKVFSSDSNIVAIEGSTGNAYSWGNNPTGQIGDGTSSNRSSPVSILGGRSFSQIAIGLNYCFGIEGSTGNAYAWGTNSAGQLGDGTTQNRSSPVSVLGGRSFSQILNLDNNAVIAIEGSTGNAYAWGASTVGQLGNGTSSTSRSSPVSVLGGRSFNRIVPAGTTTGCMAIEGSTGNLYSWGNNSFGVLGINSDASQSSPVSVLGGRSYSQLIGNNFGSRVFAIDGSTGNVYAVGNSTLGDGTSVPRSSPVSVLGGRSFSKISTSTNHSIAVEADTGVPYFWGSNGSGQFGGQFGVNYSVLPTLVSSPVSIGRVR